MKSYIPMSAVLMLLWTAGCSQRGARPSGAGTHTPTTKDVEAASFTIALPEDYEDVSAELQEDQDAQHAPVVLAAPTMSRGFRPTITLQHAPLPGGTMADPTNCRNTGNAMARKGRDGRDQDWTLKSASIVDGPVGKTCQIHILALEGVALITELNRPNETWLMTCNHAEGDATAERICRSTLTSFRFKQ